MSKLYEIVALIKPKRRTLLSAMLCGSLAAVSGCGIPCHRGALPGPQMPQFYSWTNPKSSADYEMAQSENEVSENVSTEIQDTILLANYAPPAPEAKEPVPTPIDSAASQDSEVTAEENAFVPPPVEEEAGLMIIENSAQIPQSVFFDDQHLLNLIHQALAGNQELRILAEEIQIANNEVLARSGEYRPFVTMGAGAGLEKPSRYTRAGAVEDQLEVAPGRRFPEPLPDFLVAANISWELDVWHKLRNAQDAAAMRYLGSAEGRRYITTRLVAEVAESYYELLSLDSRLMTLETTIEIQKKSLEIAIAKKEAGRGTELAVQRFQAEVRKNESERLIIQQELIEVENRINFLLGRYPQPIDRPSVEFVDLHLDAIDAGLPSELLRNRADIRQAEREVAAAGLDVKVARARFYPSFGLNAGVGLNAYNMRYLVATPEALIYNVALDLVGPLINKRAIQADYKTANAAQLQSIYNYQRTVLNAHMEVVNYISKVQNYNESIEVKKQQLKALEASVAAASQLFQNARAEYVEVLLAQREMMEAKMLLIETKQQQLSAVINAYQALGGGGF